RQAILGRVSGRPWAESPRGVNSDCSAASAGPALRPAPDAGTAVAGSRPVARRAPRLRACRAAALRSRAWRRAAALAPPARGPAGPEWAERRWRRCPGAAAGRGRQPHRVRRAEPDLLRVAPAARTAAALRRVGQAAGA